MRVRVGGNRIAKEKKKNIKLAKWREKGFIFANTNGRIQLKDLKGKSYMEMKFYNRLPLSSSKMRIIDLVGGEEKKLSKKKKILLDEFEFQKRGDRSAELRNQQNKNDLNDSRMALLNASASNKSHDLDMTSKDQTNITNNVSMMDLDDQSPAEEEEEEFD